MSEGQGKVPCREKGRSPCGEPKEVRVPSKMQSASSNGSPNTSPVVKSGKTTTGGVTPATVERLERAGSTESAKIAREYVPKT
jgi:hypothetical protein